MKNLLVGIALIASVSALSVYANNKHPRPEGMSMSMARLCVSWTYHEAVSMGCDVEEAISLVTGSK